jgi:hypothetical protein
MKEHHGHDRYKSKPINLANKRTRPAEDTPKTGSGRNLPITKHG